MTTSQRLGTTGFGTSRNSAIAVVIGVLVAFVPTWIELYRIVWQTEEQGHGPIIIAVSAWLVWRMRDRLAEVADPRARPLGIALLVAGWFCYVLGRSQAILQFEVFAHILILASLAQLGFGNRGLRMVAFPLFFLIFSIPVPGTIVQAITVPLKIAVSHVAEAMLYASGYPVARTGVTLQVGQYQLLVADACSGLNSLFSLESLGLLYMNVMGYTSRARNIALAVLIVPISFCSNVVRVVILCLVTYYFGDEAGQGFVHSFAGFVLFFVALILMLGTDKILGRFMSSER